MLIVLGHNTGRQTRHRPDNGVTVRKSVWGLTALPPYIFQISLQTGRNPGYCTVLQKRNGNDTFMFSAKDSDVPCLPLRLGRWESDLGLGSWRDAVQKGSAESWLAYFEATLPAEPDK
jgi:hypothetical protein